MFRQGRGIFPRRVSTPHKPPCVHFTPPIVISLHYRSEIYQTQPAAMRKCRSTFHNGNTKFLLNNLVRTSYETYYVQNRTCHNFKFRHTRFGTNSHRNSVQKENFLTNVVDDFEYLSLCEEQSPI